ncbi:hypothetical protein [Kitasatospora sp. NBC_00315]|uniref:hypothetical protein n=1 Tax=Kitasatospora sp. NBC_00315 TaxID=2975963 RepID=UPI00324795F8
MNNAPHLLAEDRPDFERILDEALRDGTILTAQREPAGTSRTSEPNETRDTRDTRDTSAGTGASGTSGTTATRLTSEQLRTKALLAAGTIASGAAVEYEHYTRLREHLRTPLEGPAAAPAQESTPRSTGPQTVRELAAQLGSENGAGLLPVLTVLAPILAGAAAVVLLALGYLLRAASPALVLGRSLVTAGWLTLAVGIAAMVLGIIGLILTALRDGAGPPDDADPDLRAEVADARRAWQLALRERALLPYLRANLDSEPALAPYTPAPRPAPGEESGQRQDPSASPEFSSPGYTGASFSSPGFSSPGVEGVTDPEGRTPRPAEFSSPGYSPPAFTSPDDV